MTKTTHYKNTPIGPIPSEWEVKKLNEVTDYVDYRGKTPQKTEDGILLITAKNIKDGFIDYEVSKEYVAFESYNKTMSRGLPKIGDVLFTTEAPLGNVAQVDNPNIALAQRVIKFSGKSSLDNTYLKYHFLSDDFQKTIDIKSSGGTVKGIKGSVLHKLQIPLPPLPEQQKIAEVLSTWDKAIQDTDAIIKKLVDRNKALATSLLTGESRIEAFKNSPSSVLEIKDVAKEISLKNKEDQNYTVFSCTKYNGLVPSLEYFGKKIYSDNLKTYKIIKRNQFAYATNHIEEGSMGILEKEEVGLISPMYTIFEFNENVNLDYIFKMLKSDFYINEYKRRMEGSIDRRGGLRWSAFAQIKINLPSLEEQNAIAEILNTANQEVKYYQQKLEALKLQKKGLMQQLLTGKVRTI